MRGRGLLLLSLPLAAAGSLAGHAIAYALLPTAQPQIHGYLSYAPFGLAAAAVAVVAALLLRVAGTLRGTPSTAPFVVVPLLVFACQEHLERLLAGELHGVVTERGFLLGLAVQVPFGLLAQRAARALLRGADAIVGVAAAPWTPPPAPVTAPATPAGLALPRGPVLAYGYAGRAPPR
jgi:hypothetical protein